MGKAIVIDASALLAIYLKEPEARRMATLIDAHSDRLISALTVTEVLIHVLRLQLMTAEAFRADLESMNIRVSPVDFDQAALAAEARHAYPLNLGDCFVYALARKTSSAILTLDNDFRNCGVPIVDSI